MAMTIKFEFFLHFPFKNNDKYFRFTYWVVDGPLLSFDIKYEALVDHADKLFKAHIVQGNAKAELTAPFTAFIYVELHRNGGCQVLALPILCLVLSSSKSTFITT
jgi:hypothetical protein